MQDKGGLRFLWTNIFLQWRVGAFTMAVLLGISILWSIDECTFKQQNFVLLTWRKLNDSMSLPQNPEVAPGLAPSEPPFLSKAFPDARWISVELEQNFTSNLLSRWLAPGGEPCKDLKTVEIAIPAFDGRDSIELSTGEIHEILFYAFSDSGNPRCSGGDYFETDLSGDSWKSRPPVKDHNNGSYSVSLQVHPDFPGLYNFTIILLFRHFEGLKLSSKGFAFNKELRITNINFVPTDSILPELRTCNPSDFGRNIWSGRWTRLAKNESCSIGNDGRYRCLDPNFPCRNPWCDGSLAALESNGWVYSAHCSFKIFSSEKAWDCLSNRWILFWGDSNHVDTIRNMLNFVLEIPWIRSVPRRFDMNFTDPRNPHRNVRITSIFNGHSNETKNYMGLQSLKDAEFQNLVKKYFSEENKVPDTMIMNSGLHDAYFWKNIGRFVEGAEFAAKFWAGVMDSVRRRGLQVPEVIYRTTVATGGYARTLGFNPSKMETFNWVLLQKMKEAGVVSGVIDNFDMSYAWHFDNRCNDGVHYGRAPLKYKWTDGKVGHQYFVDLMLVHVILNRACSS